MGGSSYTPPLDAINSKVWMSWGLSRHYLGVADSLRVRESGGSTEADIGTLATGLLDTAALATHIGAGSGFATKAYDEKTANTNSDMVQATAGSQPQVIASGINSLPSLRFDGGDTLVASTSSTNATAIGTGDFEVWFVAYPTSSASTKGLGGLCGQIFFYSARGGTANAHSFVGGAYRSFGLAVSINNNHVIRFYRVSGTLYCDVDGTTAGSSFASTENLTNSTTTTWGVSGEHFVGDMAEFIVIRGALSAGEKAALQSHLITRYGVSAGP